MGNELATTQAEIRRKYAEFFEPILDKCTHLSPERIEFNAWYDWSLSDINYEEVLTLFKDANLYTSDAYSRAFQGSYWTKFTLFFKDDLIGYDVAKQMITASQLLII
ncbi:hypothetical protein [Spirosoma sp. 209]|uniref:hypothetical protein n=1 Tax=Spirosoma sp. 209 TaxID=1955701 RepID=UPI00098D0142|nr:hypothetical protein [Spirosoma sp. 209]